MRSIYNSPVSVSNAAALNAWVGNAAEEDLGLGWMCRVGGWIVLRYGSAGGEC